MKNLANIFKALSDETRLKIIYLLLQKELCVCELVYIMEDSQPKISRHLAILRNTELALDRREAQMIFYSINPDNRYLEVLRAGLLEVLSSQVEEKLVQRLEKALSYRCNDKCCPDGYYPGS